MSFKNMKIGVRLYVLVALEEKNSDCFPIIKGEKRREWL
jgi:hypothetical protein